MPLFKICLLGAESTGKSSLARSLAEALRTHGFWAQALPETLRLFCDRNRRLPLLSDESLIFSAQQLAEIAAHSPEPKPRFLICDSSPLLTAFTSHWYFADDSLLEAGLAHQEGYLHCYLTEPSIAWEPDGILRDGPTTRAMFHTDLVDFLRQKRVTHEIITLKPDVVSRSRVPANAMALQLIAKAGLVWVNPGPVKKPKE